jgi:hypothetical protein
LQRTPRRRVRSASPPAFLLGSTAAAARARPRDRAGPVVPASYAVQLKAGLSGAEREAAMATLRDKYKLKIVKINRGLDLLRLRPRSARPADAKPARSLGAVLAPKIIQDLRKEPFVDAAYVDFPVSAPAVLLAVPRGCGRSPVSSRHEGRHTALCRQAEALPLAAPRTVVAGGFIQTMMRPSWRARRGAAGSVVT